MTPNEYLAKILAQQTFADDAPELKELRERLVAIEAKLREKLSKEKPAILPAGSMVKGTMIRASYDGDLTCYFPHEEDGAGATLQEIYETVAKILAEDYFVERKASALRIKEKSPDMTKGLPRDLHTDVVPGRYTDKSNGDVNLYRTTPEKERLKTNLEVHIKYIKGSGVIDAIKLAKLWNEVTGIRAKTFVLELLVVKLLKEKKKLALPDQLLHVWTEFRDNSEKLSVEDPANGNNDLKPSLDAVRANLSAVASTTLAAIETRGWTAVFGESEQDAEEKRKRLQSAVAVSSGGRSRPWCSVR